MTDPDTLPQPADEERKSMRDRYIECLADAVEVARQYNELIGPVGEMNTQDIREIATHFSNLREKNENRR